MIFAFSAGFRDRCACCPFLLYCMAVRDKMSPVWNFPLASCTWKRKIANSLRKESVAPSRADDHRLLYRYAPEKKRFRQVKVDFVSSRRNMCYPQARIDGRMHADMRALSYTWILIVLPAPHTFPCTLFFLACFRSSNTSLL